LLRIAGYERVEISGDDVNRSRIEVGIARLPERWSPNRKRGCGAPLASEIAQLKGLGSREVEEWVASLPSKAVGQSQLWGKGSSDRGSSNGWDIAFRKPNTLENFSLLEFAVEKKTSGEGRENRDPTGLVRTPIPQGRVHHGKGICRFHSGLRQGTAQGPGTACMGHLLWPFFRKGERKAQVLGKSATGLV